MEEKTMGTLDAERAYGIALCAVCTFVLGHNEALNEGDEDTAYLYSEKIHASVMLASKVFEMDEEQVIADALCFFGDFCESSGIEVHDSIPVPSSVEKWDDDEFEEDGPEEGLTEEPLLKPVSEIMAEIEAAKREKEALL